MSKKQQETVLWVDLMRERLKYSANGLYVLEIEYYLNKIAENLHDDRLVDDCIYNLQMLRIQRQQEISHLN
ncbi:hypothetical protein H6G33_17790 [Calothrix sp. FACHB-1219]|uniref:hypothetical protein n=1 Tax=unclassified Calothrix TaxID=2619626 RepID=UPI00168A0C6D|nr:MULTISPECIES: hypothetical protein [unclassified Calothrix]MBD2202731.1 hypothetical protein [Calothrix sp. FACHB-168]MBD2218884.1 hypothetical protein [Calothrix sp. FACHB-1219]